MSTLKDGAPKPRIELPASGLAHEVLAAARAQGMQDTESILHFADRLSDQHPAPAMSLPEPELTLVLFELSGEMYGIDVGYVLEALRVPSIVRVPAAPAHVRGITHLRGRILPVVEIRTRITLDPLALSERSRLLVVRVFGRMLGLLVDGLFDVLNVPKSKVEPPPAELLDPNTGYVRGICRTEDRLVLVMDIERAIHRPNKPSTGGP